MPHLQHRVPNFLGFHQFVALLIHDPALVVGDVIVIQQMLSHIEVVRFDFTLGVFDGPVQHAGLDRFIFFHAKALHHGGHAVRGKNSHQAIFQRDIESR